MARLNRRKVLSNGLVIAGAAALARGPGVHSAKCTSRASLLPWAWPPGIRLPDGFVLWTRLAPEPLAPDGGMPPAAVPVSWEVARDEQFRTVVRSGTAYADPDWAHSVHVEVADLEPRA